MPKIRSCYKVVLGVYIYSMFMYTGAVRSPNSELVLIVVSRFFFFLSCKGVASKRCG